MMAQVPMSCEDILALTRKTSGPAVVFMKTSGAYTIQSLDPS